MKNFIPKELLKQESKTILITAGNSLVGKDLINFFLKDNYFVIAVVRNNVKNFKKRYKLKLIKHDFKNKLAIKDKIDLIINTIAVHEFSEKNRLNDYYLGNILSVQNIIDLSKIKNFVPIINLSTVSIYDKKTKQFYENNPISNKSFLSLSKFTGEKILEISEANYINLRLPGILTTNVNSFQRPWIRNVIQNLKLNKKINVFNKFSLFNNIIDTYQIYDFIKYYLKNNKKIIGNYNLASDKPLKLVNVLKIIKSFFNSKSSITWKLNKKNLPTIIKTDKIKKELKYKPNSTKKILLRGLNYYN